MPGLIASRAAAIGQMAVMAAVVATICYWPVGIMVALALAAAGVSLDALLTFGGSLNRYVGMAVWWLVFFAPSLVYAAVVFPWEQTRGFSSPYE